MSADQQRIACVEELGWTSIEIHWRTLPNPLNSLEDCKPLLQMVVTAGKELTIRAYDNKWRVCVYAFGTTEKGVKVSNKQLNNAIVEAFLKWRGRWTK
jgi:hypothetical protein